jgi:Flp pilus assembly protein TadG
MYTRSLRQIATFQSDERGAVAILFGLMATAFLFLGGMALDYTRITNVHNRVSEAVDAASLAAGRALLDGKLTVPEIETLAATYITENMKSIKKSADISQPLIKIDAKKGTVDIDITAKVNMTLARIGGFDYIDVPVSSAAVFQQRDIEVGMALDITGSMKEYPSKGGKRKIDGLKDAFETFADRLIPTDKSAAQRVRIGLAPYSTAVNLDNRAGTVSANRSKDGCVTERKSGLATDGTDPFLVAQDGIKDVDPTEGNVGNDAYACPSTHITPLSNDRDQLVAEVRKFKPEGWTAGHIGVQWAWNLVSENWGGTWGGDSAPDPYARVSEGKLLKAVVLMTDGIFNTAYHGGKASDQAVALCSAMKAKGVVVFAVAFDAPSDAQKTLKACASDGGDYYANAGNAAELEAAFTRFAGKLSELRLSK